MSMNLNDLNVCVIKLNNALHNMKSKFYAIDSKLNEVENRVDTIENEQIEAGSKLEIESSEYPGCFYRLVNNEKEWVNPPMQNMTEYRTVERYNGLPVYVKQVELDIPELSGQVYYDLEHSPKSSDITILSIDSILYNDGIVIPLPAFSHTGDILATVEVFIDHQDRDNCIWSIIISTFSELANNYKANVTVKYVKSS